jgi:hypothetical protein
MASNGLSSRCLPLNSSALFTLTRLMNSAREFVGDLNARAPVPPAPIASWYTHGVSDRLGDRLLMFDNTAAASLELLRFRPDLASAPGFERALRHSVARLATFRHPSFSQVRSVQYLDGDDGLALVSAQVPGKRLSTMFHGPERRSGMHPAFATWLIRQLAPALAEFHGHAPGLAHGALTADRIVLTQDRRLVIVEHALGSALDEQHLSPEELWQDLGVIAGQRFEAAPRLDSRFDFAQLGLVALSVLLGRRITPQEYPDKLGLLLDEFTDSATRRSPSLVGPLRQWLEQALRIDGGFRPTFKTHAVPELAHSVESSASAEPLQLSPPQAILPTPETRMNDLALTSSIESGAPLSVRAGDWADASLPRRFSIVRNLAVAFAVLAAVEGVVIGGMLTRTSPAPVIVAAVPVTIESPAAGDAVMVDGQQVGVTPLQMSIGSAVKSIRVVSRGGLQSDRAAPTPGTTPPSPAGDPRTANALAAATARQRSGGLRLTSPIELQVLEGERVLGSSVDGPIVASAGVHQLDFINTAVGYRSRQTVEIKAGQIIPLKIQPPDGRVSINALPWAQVWIDGNLAGETPLANVSVPVGEHEIVFRHPQLGERRETTIVKSGVSTRISATFNR